MGCCARVGGHAFGKCVGEIGGGKESIEDMYGLGEMERGFGYRMQ